MFKKAIVIGTGKLAFTCAKMLLEKGVECEIFEYNEYPYSQLAFLCTNKGVKYHQVRKNEITEYLQQIEVPTLVVSANNTYIFPIQVVNNSNLLIVNFHPALLPKHPGRNAEAWSIYEGDEVTGITWHLVDEKIDHGKVVYQSELPIRQQTTSLQLMSSQFVMAGNGFKHISDSLIQNDINYTIYKEVDEQPLIHYAKDIPNNGMLDLNWPIEHISRFLRAMDYGKMQVMGRPYFINHEKRYIWDKYRIDINPAKEKSNLSKGIFCNNEKMITLINLREEE